jgi:transposase
VVRKRSAEEWAKLLALFERSGLSQFGLREDGAAIPPPLAAASETSIAAAAKRKKGGGRRPKPQNLPVRREVIDLPEAHKAGLVKIREELTEQIEYQPSQFFRLQIVRPVYASPQRAHAPIVATLPPQVIPQAGVGVGFIVHILVTKYLDHVPLRRQERIDARAGVWIGRQARCRYVEGAAHLLITIYQQLKRLILDSGYVQVDETFTKLIDPDRRGRSHDAYLWGYHAPRKNAIVLEFSPSRSGAILHIECIGHLRRYVLEAIKADERQALPLLKDISELYRIERQATDLGLSHERRGLFQVRPRGYRARAQLIDASGRLVEYLLDYSSPP